MNDKERSEKVRGLNVKFLRIRRITGYLVGDMSRWNTAKKQEEHDRMKHDFRKGFTYIELIICILIITIMYVKFLPMGLELKKRVEEYNSTSLIENYINSGGVINDDNILSQYIGKQQGGQIELP